MVSWNWATFCSYILATLFTWGWGKGVGVWTVILCHGMLNVKDYRRGSKTEHVRFSDGRWHSDCRSDHSKYERQLALVVLSRTKWPLFWTKWSPFVFCHSKTKCQNVLISNGVWFSEFGFRNSTVLTTSSFSVRVSVWMWMSMAATFNSWLSVRDQMKESVTQETSGCKTKKFQDLLEILRPKNKTSLTVL